MESKKSGCISKISSGILLKMTLDTIGRLCYTLAQANKTCKDCDEDMYHPGIPVQRVRGGGKRTRQEDTSSLPSRERKAARTTVSNGSP